MHKGESAYVAADAAAAVAAVAALRAACGDAAAQVAQCLILHELCVPQGADAVAAVVSALDSAPADIGLQAAGCAALARLACDSAANQAAGATHGAVRVALLALDTHRSSPECSMRAISVLANMAALNFSNAAKALSGVPAVLLAMRASPDAAQLQMTACDALDKLLHVYGGSVLRVGAAEHSEAAVLAVTAALRAHPGDYNVQFRGSLTLSNLVYCSAAVCVAARRAGASAVLVAALVAFGKPLAAGPGLDAQRCDLLRCVLTTLSNLWTETDSAGDALAAHKAAGALTAALAVMASHPAAAPIQGAGCHVLCSMLVSHDEGGAAGAAGAVRAVLAAMASHPGDATISSNALDALFILCRDNPTNAAAVFAAGAPAAVAVSMRAFPGLVRSQRSGCLRGMTPRCCACTGKRAGAAPARASAA